LKSYLNNTIVNTTDSEIESGNKYRDKLNPYFITGFSDAESSFLIGSYKDDKRKTGWIVALEFTIVLHEKEEILLEAIRNFFSGVGIVKKVNNNLIRYQVRSINDLAIIIAHFDQYPLISQKWSDYQLFRQAFQIVNRKEHLSIEGLKKILSLKASMNKGGLSDKLKGALPNIIPVQRPLSELPTNISPYWLAGFITGEGCFFINIYKATTKLGFAVTLVFQVTQHSRDIELMKRLISFFECGRYALRSNKDYGDFLVTTFSDIYDKILPFFQKYEIKGAKADDFADFCKAAEIIKAKGHLTSDGLNKLLDLKEGMNKKRLF